MFTIRTKWLPMRCVVYERALSACSSSESTKAFFWLVEAQLCRSQNQTSCSPFCCCWYCWAIVFFPAAASGCVCVRYMAVCVYLHHSFMNTGNLIHNLYIFYYSNILCGAVTLLAVLATLVSMKHRKYAENGRRVYVSQARVCLCDCSEWNRFPIYILVFDLIFCVVAFPLLVRLTRSFSALPRSSQSTLIKFAVSIVFIILKMPRWLPLPTNKIKSWIRSIQMYSSIRSSFFSLSLS